LKRLRRTIRVILISLIGIFVLLFVILNLAGRFVTNQANRILESAGVPVHIQHIRTILPNRVDIRGVSITGNSGDTLIYVDEIQTRLAVMQLLKAKVAIGDLHMDNVNVLLSRDIGDADLDIAEAFTPKEGRKSKPQKKKKNWEIGIANAEISEIMFQMNDVPSGLHLKHQVVKIFLGDFQLSLEGREIVAGSAELEGYKGEVILTASEIEKTREASNPWNYAVRDARLKQVDFTFEDIGQSLLLHVGLGDGQVQTNQVDIPNRLVDIELVLLSQPSITMLTTSSGNEGSRPLNSINWDLAGKSIVVEKGNLVVDSYIKPDPPADPQGLELSDLNLALADLVLSGVNANLSMESLQFETGSGLVLESAQADLHSEETYSSWNVGFQTSNSQLQMEGEAGDPMLHLIGEPSAVNNGRLRILPSTISLTDLGFFISSLKELPWFNEVAEDPISLSGDFSLDRSLLSITESSVSHPENFSMDLRGSITELFDPSVSAMSLTLDVPFINVVWLQDMLSEYGIEPGVNSLEEASLAGDLSDNYRSPGIDFRVRSNLGDVDVTGQIDFNAQSYDFNTTLEKLMLGELTGMDELGMLTGSGTIKGVGLDPSSIRATIDMSIDTLGFRQYPYTGARITGSLMPDTIQVVAFVADSNLYGSIEGVIITPTDSAFMVNASTSLKAALHELHLSGDTLYIDSEGDFQVEKTPHALNADFELDGLRLETPFRAAEIGEFQVNFLSDTSRTRLQVGADFIQLHSDVDVSVDSLPTLKRSYREYVTSLIDTVYENDALRLGYLPDMLVQGNMTYHDVLGILLKDTTLWFSNLRFSLSNNAPGNTIKYDLQGNDLEYKNLRTGDLRILVTDSAGILDLGIDAIDNTFQSTQVKQLSVESQFGDWESQNTLSLLDQQDRVLYHFEVFSKLDSNLLALYVPSRSLILNRTRWQMETPDLLSFNITTGDFYPSLRIHQDDAVIEFFTERSEGTSQYGLVLDKVDFSSILTEEVIPGNPSGAISGNLTYTPHDNGNKEVKTTLRLDQVHWSELDLRTMNLEGLLNSSENGDYQFAMSALMDTSRIEVAAHRKDSTEQQIQAEINKLPVKTFQPFVNTYLSDLRGMISGNFRMYSSGSVRDLSGGLNISNGGVRVNSLNSRFRIPGDSIALNERRLEFNRFTILDTLNNELEVDGYIDFRPEGSILTNLDIASSRLQVMNKADDDQATFAGNVVLDSRLRVRGPLSSPVITGRLKLNEGSRLYYRHEEDLNISETEKTIYFITYNEEGEVMRAPERNTTGTLKRTSIETEVEINPTTRFSFNLSKQIYNINLEIVGGGVLNYRMLGNNQNLLSGRYEVREGTADLKMVGWPGKSFSITEGGYVRWDGPVENPELKFEAVNRVRTSYINPVDGQAREVDFNVVLSLENQLSDLYILFTVNTPDQYLMSIINTLSPEEQMRQAITVLLFERVDLPGISTSSNYMTEQVNQLVASQLNQLTKTTIQGVDISFGIDSYVAATEGGGEQVQTSFSYEVRKGLLNERAQIEISGRLNELYNQPGASDHTLNNISFEYRLDSAATKFFKVYNEHVYEDVFEGEVISTGVGLTFRKRYETFGDILKRDRDKRKKREKR